MANFTEILNRLEEIPPYTAIPLPRSGEARFVKWSNKQADRAIVYERPNRRNTNRHFYQRRVALSEFHAAYERLRETGEFTREWFQGPRKGASSDFTVIGGIFELIGVATYAGPGTYRFPQRDDR